MQEMRTWSSIGFIIGSILTVIGIGIYSGSDYGMPPVPAGWLVAVIFLCIGSSIMLSSLMLGTKFYVMAFVGVNIFSVGVRLILLYPYVMPECTCPAETYGPNCLECKCIHGQCDDGYRGTGGCLCDLGWAGTNCDQCGPTFTGINCNKCKHGWDGPKCDRCFPGYTGKLCNDCLPTFEKSNEIIQKPNITGTVCQPCKVGWGGYCLPMPDCQLYDKNAVAKDAQFWKNIYNPSQCTTLDVCENRYDCTSFNCRGICVDGDMTYNRCAEDLECPVGTCQYKTCCEELQFGDGTCECKTQGYFGPLCEKCPGFDGVYTASICNGHGTCTAMYADSKYSHLECACSEGWSGEDCGCFGIDTCTKCADGFFGPTCKKCPGGGGIDQCNGHGKCKDGVDGDGSCVCDKAFWQAFGGDACDQCYSGAFRGSECEVCNGGELLGVTCPKCFKFNNNYIRCP